MTPAQLTHLHAIYAHLAKLLDIAAKRTPGGWETSASCKTPINCGGKHIAMVNYYKCGKASEDVYGEEHEANAAFIASCAGNAEAGWKATRAAIEWLTAGPVFSNEGLDMLETILAAFPLESLSS